MTKITKNTLVPIGAVLGCLGVFTGFVVWLTTMHNRTEDTAMAVTEIKETYTDELRGIRQGVNDVNSRLSKVEGKLDHIILIQERNPYVPYPSIGSHPAPR